MVVGYSAQSLFEPWPGFGVARVVGSFGVAKAIAAFGQQVELTGLGEHQLVYPVPPAAADLGAELENLHEVGVLQTETAEVCAGEAEVAHRRHHHRGALQPLRLLRAVEASDQRLRRHASRNVARPHHLGDRRGRDIDVGEDRHVPEALAVHVLFEFVELAEVVAELGDNEPRAEEDLQLELVELHHLVRLVALVGADHRSREEIERRGLDLSRSHLVADPFAQGLHQPQDQHRVEVVDALCLPLESLVLDIAGESEDILRPHVSKAVQPGLDEASVAILAGEVRDRRQAVLQYERHKRLRRQRGPTGRQVGETDDLDAVRFLGGIADKILSLRHGVVPAQHQLRRTDETVFLQRGSQMVHSHGSS